MAALEGRRLVRTADGTTEPARAPEGQRRASSWGGLPRGRELRHYRIRREVLGDRTRAPPDPSGGFHDSRCDPAWSCQRSRSPPGVRIQREFRGLRATLAWRVAVEGCAQAQVGVAVPRYAAPRPGLGRAQPRAACAAKASPPTRSH